MVDRQDMGLVATVLGFDTVLVGGFVIDIRMVDHLDTVLVPDIGFGLGIRTTDRPDIQMEDLLDTLREDLLDNQTKGHLDIQTVDHPGSPKEGHLDTLMEDHPDIPMADRLGIQMEDHPDNRTEDLLDMVVSDSLVEDHFGTLHHIVAEAVPKNSLDVGVRTPDSLRLANELLTLRPNRSAPVHSENEHGETLCLSSGQELSKDSNRERLQMRFVPGDG